MSGFRRPKPPSAAFWAKQSRQFTALHEKHGKPQVHVRKTENGRWQLYGDELTPDLITDLNRMHAKCARACGFAGSDEDAAQYWLNRIYASKLRGSDATATRLM